MLLQSVCLLDFKKVLSPKAKPEATDGLETLPARLKTYDPSGMANGHDSVVNFDGCPRKTMSIPKSARKFLGLIFIALASNKTGIHPILGRRGLHGRAESSTQF